MRRRLTVAITILSFHTTAHAQDSSLVRNTIRHEQIRDRAWFTRHDTYGAGAGIAAVGLFSLLDETVAKASQRRSLQSNDFLRNSTKAIQAAGDPGALLLSASLYVAGRVTDHRGLSQASKHAVMSIAVSSVFTQTLKLSAGRARPNLTNDNNAYVFHLFHGAKTDYNSFPSGHATAAFAAAGAFGSELALSHPKAGRIVGPALYGVAALVGGSRIYNNRHWLSDVLAGALIGEVTGRRVVKLTHGDR